MKIFATLKIAARALKRNNDRAWFHANREAWDEHVRHGFEDLVTMLLLAGAHADDRLAHVDPRACLFRIANDTRFHKQKDPYKTWLSAWMSPGGKNGAFAGYYAHVAPGASHFSAGIWVPEKPALHALRSTFNPAAFKVLRRICIDLCTRLRATNERIVPSTSSRKS